MAQDFPSGPSLSETDGAGILSCESGVAIAYRRTPGNSDRVGVMFLGGFRSDMTGNKARSLESFCRSGGIGFLCFDYQGHGQSSTRFEDCTLDTWIDDAVRVLDALTTGPQILVGSSMGGWIAFLLAQRRVNRINSIVAIAPALDFTEDLIWKRLAPDQRATLLMEGGLTIPSAYDPGGYRITKALLDSGRRHLLLDHPINFAGTVRIVHGMADQDVPWHSGLRLTQALTGTDVALTLVKEGDHRLSRPQDLARLTEIVRQLCGEADPHYARPV